MPGNRQGEPPGLSLQASRLLRQFASFAHILGTRRLSAERSAALPGTTVSSRRALQLRKSCNGWRVRREENGSSVLHGFRSDICSLPAKAVQFTPAMGEV